MNKLLSMAVMAAFLVIGLGSCKPSTTSSNQTDADQIITEDKFNSSIAFCQELLPGKNYAPCVVSNFITTTNSSCQENNLSSVQCKQRKRDVLTRLGNYSKAKPEIHQLMLEVIGNTLNEIEK